MNDEVTYGVALAALVLIAAAIISACVAVGLAYGVPYGFAAFCIVCLIASLVLFRWVWKQNG